MHWHHDGANMFNRLPTEHMIPCGAQLTNQSMGCPEVHDLLTCFPYQCIMKSVIQAAFSSFKLHFQKCKGKVISDQGRLFNLN